MCAQHIASPPGLLPVLLRAGSPPVHSSEPSLQSDAYKKKKVCLAGFEPKPYHIQTSTIGINEGVVAIQNTELGKKL